MNKPDTKRDTGKAAYDLLIQDKGLKSSDDFCRIKGVVELHLKSACLA